MNHLKNITTSQADIHRFKNLKNVTPTYASISNSYITNQPHILPKQRHPSPPLPSIQIHTQKFQVIRVNEIKFLYIKKQNTNQQLYQYHLKLAQTWGNTWPYIENIINEKLKLVMKRKYSSLNSKLEKLKNTQ
jgi:hypothetical protein